MNGTAESDRAPGSRHRHPLWSFAGPAVILLVSLVAMSPQFIRGASCGHDADFHFFSWLDAHQAWREGILYPRWAPSPDYRAGEPRFIFYPPLEWMAGAALGTVLSWKLVPLALSFLILAGTGLAVRALAREVMEDGPATLAGCVAIFSGYALFTAYERTDFAELTGGIWIPLLLLYLLRDRNASESSSQGVPGRAGVRALFGSAHLLALPLAAAWLSNAPLGVMTSYLLAGMALAVALISRSWAPVFRAAAGTVLGVGLAAVYIVPAAWEERWVAISRATGDLGTMVQGSWLFARHQDPNLALHDVVLHQVSLIAVAMTAVTLAGVLVSWRRGRLPGQRRWWLPLAGIPAVVLILQFPISFPVWKLLPELHFMQFPWRWLVVVEAPMGIFFAAAVWGLGRRWTVAVLAFCAALMIGETAWAGQFWFQACDPEDTVPAMLSQFHAGTVLNDSDQYAPPGSDDALLAMGLPDACLVSDSSVPLGKENDDGTLAWDPSQGSCEATYSAQHDRRWPEHWLIGARIPHPGTLVLRLRRYPAWRVRVNGKTVSNLPGRADGLIAVPVPAGQVEVRVDWTTTPDVILGWLLSGLSVAALAGVYLLERKGIAHPLLAPPCSD